jgi:hypothetical protein
MAGTPAQKGYNEAGNTDSSRKTVELLAGWPTPRTVTGGAESAERKQELGRTESGGGDLQAVAVLAGWPTATSSDAKNSANRTATRHDPNSRHHDGETLVDAVAQLAGWPTPRAEERDQYNSRDDYQALSLKVRSLAGWSTPKAEDSEQTGAPRGVPDTLTSQARLSGWATPTQRDHKDGASTLENTPINALLGRQVSLSTAETARPAGSLNPALSRWLQGYPVAWCQAAIRAYRTMRTTRRRRG